MFDHAPDVPKVVYVDVDGTLLDNRADFAYHSRARTYGEEAALEWYATNCPDDLELNTAVLAQLIMYKLHGYRVVLWTNRSMNQFQPTLRNLGRYGLHRFFDAMLFGNGRKRRFVDNNIIAIDNEWRSLEGLTHPLFVFTFTA